MKGITIIIVILVIGIARAQLNYEGNPLTENTEYTAEESEFSSKIVKPSINEAQKLYPIYRESKDVISKDTKLEENESNGDVSLTNFDHAETSSLVNIASARELSDNVYNKMQQSQIIQPITNTVKTPAEIALNTFLNSKTPEESRLSLDYFLQNSQSQNNQSPTSNNRKQFVSQNNQLTNQRQQQQQQLVTNPVEKQQMFYQSQNVLQIPEQTYDYTAHYTSNSQILQPSQSVQTSPMISNPTALQQSSIFSDPLEMIQSRNDIVSPVMWRQRNRWIRGQPYPFAQPRIGSVFSKGPVIAPFPPPPRKGPVELIYTKPPGYHHRGPPTHGPPSEDASAWFPDANNPPPPGDIYYSQLYAQSYDPNYYNYIAKTGKIKPHLYGKLGKYPEHEDGGIWAELYRGFTKHGLKNIMTPGFLLGMTLPMITAMLMALVQKRSFGRYDSRNLQEVDHFQEYLQRLQRAMECYERKRRKTGKVTTDEC
ncbi:PREDICTED: uncharacterized protein LOC107072031 [Polistes dominula]|uniref:Uncharacterized protein LOC107072031 n=1 Tax=Polistes dominula TaxID=743375 RepID=A0ABM1J3Q2_POLDO|nr:PREDICTED: uncharacterized protein LOC107072031 [Polistes dominula]XP_015187090.1 PREDICTED: uncharacterized protein LOC107072031 [Polistes dominula]XP_015187091.1 PREDICTED: uncharacterized protein LOC107072031 [Polistes dominula]XP_015187092.1 PREDICTED: uncharacterized protein LOC107072031 [Polistes dominula]